MNKLEKLKEEAQKINIKIKDIEYKKLINETIPKLEKSVGRCFVFRNSYGGGYEKWNLYTKILSIDKKNRNFTTTSFQETSMNIIEIKHSQVYNFNGENYFDRYNSGYKEITKGEYNKQKRRIIKRVQKILD